MATTRRETSIPLSTPRLRDTPPASRYQELTSHPPGLIFLKTRHYWGFALPVVAPKALKPAIHPWNIDRVLPKYPAHPCLPSAAG